ncbi:MAG: aldehyde dehydrogenase family protein [Acidimicrobiales bacterium]
MELPGRHTCGWRASSLAAGNPVVLKPAPEVPRCSALIVDACRQAGLDESTVAYLRCPDNEVGAT